MNSENISAISTCLGASGVAIIRISGDSPLKIAEKMFKPLGKTSVPRFEPYKMYLGEIDGGSFKDCGLCVYFKAPQSYTGEDIVEFHTHGGIAITKGVLKRTLELGCRLATNGEFTRRAFLNGKLSLSSCEGLIDMINSESESGVKAGYYLYREKLNLKIAEMQDKLTFILADIDADMDFPEEDLEKRTTDEIEKTLKEVLADTEKLIGSFSTGRTLVNGVRVGIIGKPNTGKSSILNALLKYDRAIVSSVAGTTRDVVDGSVDYNGVRLNFYDTAGIRESDDEVEKLGVTLSKKTAEECDILLFIVDKALSNEEKAMLFNLKGENKTVLTVLNKSDLKTKTDISVDLTVSAKTGENIEQLKSLIYERTLGGGIDLNGDFLCETRHFEALKKAQKRLKGALDNLGNVPLDLLAIDIKDGWDALGEISGKTASEEIINEIFSKFCVGK